MKITALSTRRLSALAVVLAAAAAIGCSSQNPTAPVDTTNTIQTIGGPIDNRSAQKGDTFTHEGVVERVDFKSGVLYFTKGFSVVVPSDAIVRLWSSKRLIAFEPQYIHEGSTLTVRGTYKESGLAVAEVVEVHQELGDNTVRPNAN